MLLLREKCFSFAVSWYAILGKLSCNIFHSAHNFCYTEILPLVDHVLSEGRDTVLSVYFHALHNAWNMADAGCLTEDSGYLHRLASM